MPPELDGWTRLEYEVTAKLLKAVKWIMEGTQWLGAGAAAFGALAKLRNTLCCLKLDQVNYRLVLGKSEKMRKLGQSVDGTDETVAPKNGGSIFRK